MARAAHAPAVALSLALALALAGAACAKPITVKDATNCTQISDALNQLIGQLANATKSSALKASITLDCAAPLNCSFSVFQFAAPNATLSKNPKVSIAISGGSKCKKPDTAKAWSADLDIDYPVAGPFDVKLIGMSLTGYIDIRGKNTTKDQKVTLKDVSVKTSTSAGMNFVALETVAVTGGTITGATSFGLSSDSITKSISVTKTTFDANEVGVSIDAPAGKALTKLSGLTFKNTPNISLGEPSGFNIQVYYLGDKVNTKITKPILEAASGNGTAICISSATNVTKPVVKISGAINPQKADKKAFPLSGWPLTTGCNVAAVNKGS